METKETLQRSHQHTPTNECFQTWCCTHNCVVFFFVLFLKKILLFINKIFATFLRKVPLFEIAGKYVKAVHPQRKIIYLIKRTSRKGLESWWYNYKRPISVNPCLCSKEPHMEEPGHGQWLSAETTQCFHKWRQWEDDVPLTENLGHWVWLQGPFYCSGAWGINHSKIIYEENHRQSISIFISQVYK